MLVYQRVNGRTSKIQVNISFMYNIEKLSFFFEKKPCGFEVRSRVFQGKQLMDSSQMVAKRTKSCYEVDIVLNFQIYLLYIPLYILYSYIYVYISTLWDYRGYTSFLWELFICIIYICIQHPTEFWKKKDLLQQICFTDAFVFQFFFP